ncbi:Uncharacterised protein [uncultured archaeon]|nr:Uncharacterised protein [uncultured archaeon]
MKSQIKSVMLVASVALCLMVMPALSAPYCSLNNTSAIGCKLATGGLPDNDSLKASETLVMPVHSTGSGFAISDSQYHFIKMNIVGAVEFDIAKINSLVSDNKTLAQIKSDMKSEIYSEMDAAPYNGSLVIGNDLFRLSDIKSKTTGDDNSTIDAIVAGPITSKNDSNASKVVGHISLAISSHENIVVGKGKLTMTDGSYSGEYDALIKINSGRGDYDIVALRPSGMRCMGGMRR